MSIYTIKVAILAMAYIVSYTLIYHNNNNVEMLESCQEVPLDLTMKVEEKSDLSESQTNVINESQTEIHDHSTSSLDLRVIKPETRNDVSYIKTK